MRQMQTMNNVHCELVYFYEGRSTNKLQNDIILLIFKTCKFGNICFVGNLIGDILKFL